jgi:hypothetical protein
LVNIIPDLSRRVEWQPYRGKVVMHRRPENGDGYREFPYDSNLLSTAEFIDCMFKGQGYEKIWWIGNDPANYRMGPTRRGADAHAGVFRVSGILDPDFRIND